MNLNSVDSLAKDCDRLALVLECIFEKKSGISTPEIESAFANYHLELARSEWASVRELIRILTDYWFELSSSHAKQ